MVNHRKGKRAEHFSCLQIVVGEGMTDCDLKGGFYIFEIFTCIFDDLFQALH